MSGQAKHQKALRRAKRKRVRQRETYTHQIHRVVMTPGDAAPAREMARRLGLTEERP